jgi:hypothetical protein
MASAFDRDAFQADAFQIDPPGTLTLWTSGYTNAPLVRALEGFSRAAQGLVVVVRFSACTAVTNVTCRRVDRDCLSSPLSQSIVLA